MVQDIPYIAERQHLWSLIDRSDDAKVIARQRSHHHKPLGE
jgi:hypothetical protein